MRAISSSPRRRQHGFTLMELVITIVVIATLALVGTSMFRDAFTTTRIVAASQTSANDVRYAVERIAREVREVKYIDKATGYSISSPLTAGTSNLVFVRGDDVTVTIDRSGSLLTLGYSSPAITSTLASQVSSFSLSFLALDNASGRAVTSATTLASKVRYVVVTLTVVDGTSGQAITERVRVALRNSGAT